MAAYIEVFKFLIIFKFSSFVSKITDMEIWAISNTLYQIFNFVIKEVKRYINQNMSVFHIIYHIACSINVEVRLEESSKKFHYWPTSNKIDNNGR